MKINRLKGWACYKRFVTILVGVKSYILCFQCNVSISIILILDIDALLLFPILYFCTFLTLKKWNWKKIFINELYSLGKEI